MLVASWNLNSVRARFDRLIAWLEANQPDVLCLQELKCKESDFPMLELQAMGYHVAAYGQPTYNGVAILSKTAPEDVVRGVPGDDDPEARVIAATVNGVRVISVYVPNGQTVGSDKWIYKLKWLRRFREDLLDKHYSPDQPLLICGDYNVAPKDVDVYNPKLWAKTVICHPEARASYGRLLEFGLEDTLRLYEDGALYSWWDYKSGFDLARGLRIDMILATDAMVQRCEAAGIDREERGSVKPSDHAPVWARFGEGEPQAG
jgi:exodeoxyribonuclease-3